MTTLPFTTGHPSPAGPFDLSGQVALGGLGARVVVSDPGGARLSTGTTDTPRCSALSLAVSEPLAGTAAPTSAWLLVEQPGGWQRDAVDSPHPDHPDAMTALLERAVALGVRVQLLRRPAVKGSPKDDPSPWLPLVVLAATDAAGGRAVSSRVPPERLNALADDGTLDALVGGVLPLGWDDVERLWAVCTHGRRDTCCALLGRGLVGALSAAEPGLVWETTHLGGHRFAPTTLLLPDGLVYGRVADDRVHDLVAAQRGARIVTDLLRGRAALDPATQVAEIALREHVAAPGAGDVVLTAVDPAVVLPTDPAVTRAVSRWTAGGREWRVLVDAAVAAARPVSCGADPTRPVGHTVVEVTDVEAAGRGASGWDERHRRASPPTPGDADARVADAVASLAPGRALDLACGTGRHSLALARDGWDVTAVDFSREALGALGEAAVRLDLPVHRELADARVWAPPDDAGFDLVVLSFVHLPGVLERAAAWLRPGGRLVSVGHAVRNLSEGVGGPSDVRLLHDPEKLTAAARAAGLQVKRCTAVQRQTPHGTAHDVVLVAVRSQ